MPIISISIPNNLLDKLDDYIRRYGYIGRSELIREAIREYMASKHPEEFYKGKLYGILIILTDHTLAHTVDEKVIESIHIFQPSIRSFYHQMLEKNICLNIAIVEAYWPEIQLMSKTLRKIRGVIKYWFIPFKI